MTFLSAIVESRTIRTRIFTNENGTKELMLDKNSDLPQSEIDFLIKDLNNINIKPEKSVVKEDKVLVSVAKKKNETKKVQKLDENILMKHWNTLTEVGWRDDAFRRPVKKMYINNTRILKFGSMGETTTEKAEESDKVEKVNDEAMREEPIEGRKLDLDDEIGENNETKTNLTEVNLEKLPKSRSIWDIFSHLYQCVEHYTIQDGLFNCLSIRVSGLLGSSEPKSNDEEDEDKDEDEDEEIFEDSSNSTETEGRYNTRKSIYGSKRFIYHVLLPLLVTIVIKYLLALPFIVLGILTTKTFWLSLLSAGAVTFGDMMKKRDFNIVYGRSPVSKKFGQVQGSGVVEVNSVPPGSNLYWSQLPVPWSVSKSDNRVVRMIPIDDKFYM